MSKKAKRVYDENGNVTHKVCGKCGVLKGIDEFNANKRASDGHRSECKECEKKYKEECKKQPKHNVAEKICSKCGELKGIDEFYAKGEASDGHRSECKECNKKYWEEYWEENKEQTKERNKKYWEENKEQIKEHNKKYYEENKEQIKEQNKKYQEENKEQIKEQKKKYYEENKEQRKEYRKKYWEELCDEAITRIKTIVEQDPTRYDYKVGKEIYGVIYLVCCKPTNKYYVGQTTIGFDNRYPSGFLNDGNHRTKDDLKEDLEKYGEDSFEFTEIFKVAHNKEELDALEVYYIDYFDSYYNGYNETRGNHHTK